MRCPLCGKNFAAEQSTAKPFCSDRCRAIDLGRWLGEDYRLPAVRDEDEAELPEEDQPSRD